MYFFCELGVSKWVILLGLCGSAVNILVVRWPPISDYGQWLLQLFSKVLNLVQTCQYVY